MTTALATHNLAYEDDDAVSMLLTLRGTKIPTGEILKDMAAAHQNRIKNYTITGGSESAMTADTKIREKLKSPYVIISAATMAHDDTLSDDLNITPDLSMEQFETQLDMIADAGSDIVNQVEVIQEAVANMDKAPTITVPEPNAFAQVFAGVVENAVNTNINSVDNAGVKNTVAPAVEIEIPDQPVAHDDAPQENMADTSDTAIESETIQNDIVELSAETESHDVGNNTDNADFKNTDTTIDNSNIIEMSDYQPVVESVTMDVPTPPTVEVPSITPTLSTPVVATPSVEAVTPTVFETPSVTPQSVLSVVETANIDSTPQEQPQVEATVQHQDQNQPQAEQTQQDVDNNQPQQEQIVDEQENVQRAELVQNVPEQPVTNIDEPVVQTYEEDSLPPVPEAEQPETSSDPDPIIIHHPTEVEMVDSPVRDVDVPEQRIFPDENPAQPPQNLPEDNPVTPETGWGDNDNQPEFERGDATPDIIRGDDDAPRFETGDDTVQFDQQPDQKDPVEFDLDDKGWDFRDFMEKVEAETGGGEEPITPCGRKGGCPPGCKCGLAFNEAASAETQSAAQEIAASYSSDTNMSLKI